MKASRKVEDGKFLELVYEDGELTIVGDFFVHPEAAIEDLERIVETALEDGSAEVSDIERAIETFLQYTGVELLGVTPIAIAELAVEVRA